MATVYKGFVRGAAGFQRAVAVKHIRPEFRQLKNYIDMFIEEARVGSEPFSLQKSCTCTMFGWASSLPTRASSMNMSM